MRFWPTIAGLLIAGLVAWFTYQIDPDNAWVYIVILLLGIAVAHAEDFDRGLRMIYAAINQ